MIPIIKSEVNSFGTISDLKDHIYSESDARFIETTISDVSVNDSGVRIADKQFGLKECGLNSLCNRINMPVDYANRIPTDLFIHSANRLIKEKGDYKITANVLDGNLRAVHSGLYMPITNKQVVDSLVVPDGTKVRRINISDEFMSIALTNPNKKIEAKVGDIIEAGAEINNSETGHSTFSALQYIYQLVCSNGARMAELADAQRKIHMGYFDFDPKPYLNSVGKFLENGADKFNDAFKKMLDSKLEDRVLKNLETDIRISIGKKDAKEMVDNWMKAETSAYGVYDSVTRTAHSFNRGFGIQQNLERVGGKILKMFV